MSSAFKESAENIKRFEAWAISIVNCFEKFVSVSDDYWYYENDHVRQLYSAFLAGLSYSNFEAATGLKKAPNAGFNL